MTNKDMLHILIEGQQRLQSGLDVLQKGYNELKLAQDDLKKELAVLREETRVGFKGVHERLDKQGKQLAYLEDDSPTRAEYDGLVKRVEKVEEIVL